MLFQVYNNSMISLKATQVLLQVTSSCICFQLMVLHVQLLSKWHFSNFWFSISHTSHNSATTYTS